MSLEPTLADRVAALEQEIAVLKVRLIQLSSPPDWLDRISGSMNDNPAFEEAMKYGREFRQTHRCPMDDEFEES